MMSVIFVIGLMFAIAAFVAVRPKQLFTIGEGVVATRSSDAPFELKRTLLIIGPQVNDPACSEQRRFIKPIVRQLLNGGHRLVEIYGHKAPAQNGVALDWLDNQLLRTTFDAEQGFHMLYVDDDGRMKFKVSSPILGDAVIMIVDPVDGRLALPPVDPVDPEQTYIDTDYGYDPDNPPPPSPMAAREEEGVFGPDMPPPRPERVGNFPVEPDMADFDESLFEKPDFDQFGRAPDTSVEATLPEPPPTAEENQPAKAAAPGVLRTGRPAGLYAQPLTGHIGGNHTVKARGYFAGEQRVTPMVGSMKNDVLPQKNGANPFAKRAQGLFDAIEHSKTNHGLNGTNGNQNGQAAPWTNGQTKDHAHRSGLNGSNGHAGSNGTKVYAPTGSNGLYDHQSTKPKKSRITFKNISISGD